MPTMQNRREGEQQLEPRFCLTSISFPIWSKCYDTQLKKEYNIIAALLVSHTCVFQFSLSLDTAFLAMKQLALYALFKIRGTEQL
jgi:hypothetical protein